MTWLLEIPPLPPIEYSGTPTTIVKRLNGRELGRTPYGLRADPNWYTIYPFDELLVVCVNPKDNVVIR